MATIDEFKAQLIGGKIERPNRFRVFIPRSGNRIEFLCKNNTQFRINLGEIPVNFRGHILKLAGDRTFEDWSVTIINDSEFSARSKSTRSMATRHSGT